MYFSMYRGENVLFRFRWQAAENDLQIALMFWYDCFMFFNWKLKFDLQGSKLDDLTTNRTISTRSIDLRLWFEFTIAFTACAQFCRFYNRLKEESRGFQSVIESSKMNTCSENYDQIEVWSWIVRSRRDRSIGCQIVSFGPL